MKLHQAIALVSGILGTASAIDLIQASHRNPRKLQDDISFLDTKVGTDSSMSMSMTAAGIGEKSSKGSKSKAGKSQHTISIEPDDMDALIDAFCGAAVMISEAFWGNDGQHHTQENAYPQGACDAAYDEAVAALSGAYNYPDPVLFKPTLTTGDYTFRPTKQGALSYFIGTDCLLKSGTAEDQFPPGNDGSDFREYGFALANYAPNYSGFSGCEWQPDSYVTGGNVGVAQGKVVFQRTEGTTSPVDKTFSFGIDATTGGIVITGHHSSSVIDEEDSTQYEFGAEE